MIIRCKDAKVIQKITTSALRFKQLGYTAKLQILTKATDAMYSAVGEKNMARIQSLVAKLDDASEPVIRALNTPLFNSKPKSILRAESVITKYGDDTAEFIEKHGDDFLNYVEKHGDNFINELKRTPNNFNDVCDSFDEIGGRMCFITGTLISTAEGLVPIENIQINDKVWSFNEATSQASLKIVDNTFVNETSELTHISTNGEVISATPEHPFYVSVKGWVHAKNLRAGDVLFTLNGEYVTVEAVQHEILENPVKVYNFEVREFHTYFVGYNSFGVHNADCGWKEFKNTSGTELKYKAQHPNSIKQSINARLKTTDVGAELEGRVGKAIMDVAPDDIKGFGIKINNGNVGEIDILTDNYIIEVKKSFAALKDSQIDNLASANYINCIDGKRRQVIFFIENQTSTSPEVLKLVQKIDDYGIPRFDSVDELLKYMGGDIVSRELNILRKRIYLL